MPRSLNGEYFGRKYDFSEVFADKALFNSCYKLVFHSGGFEEGFGRRRPAIGDEKPYVYEEYQALGYNIDGQGYPGYHEWHVWRQSAREFATRLFK
jgi:hypothetical protein